MGSHPGERGERLAGQRPGSPSLFADTGPLPTAIDGTPLLPWPIPPIIDCVVFDCTQVAPGVEHSSLSPRTASQVFRHQEYPLRHRGLLGREHGTYHRAT